jgi:hypothetical protein
MKAFPALRPTALIAALALLLACGDSNDGDDTMLPWQQPGGGSETGEGGEGGSDNSAGGSAPTSPTPTPLQELDKEYAQALYATTTDVMRFMVAPTCAAENNECHNNEDFPDMSTEGNLWNLVDLRCNLGVGERETVEDYCESQGDSIEVAGFTTTIGAITTELDVDGEFLHYAVTIETALPASYTGETFNIMRNGVARPEIGGGNSLDGTAGSNVLQITDSADLPDPLLVLQGDENGNGVFGNGSGVLVKRGDVQSSYLLRRLMGEETARVRMPLNENADNPTEVNAWIDREASYALMSWILCMQPDDGPYSPIRYDCPENANNEGLW